MRSKYWENYEVGQNLKTAGRTITEADLVAWSGLTGDYYPLHMDEEYARQTNFGGRIAHGPLTFAYAIGLVGQTNVFADSLVGWLGVNNLKALRPVYPGDTIRVTVTVASKRETRHADRGVMTMIYTVTNQRDEVVLECESAFMCHRRS